jgi:hypothetical protein
MKTPLALFGFRQKPRTLRKCESGVSLVEFGFAAPLLLMMISGGAELANYAITKMRVSALALQVADNAARIGEGDPLAAKRITEAQINDILQGALAQGGSLNVNGFSSEKQANGNRIANPKARIIISSLEPDPDTVRHPNRNWIHWQRCYGQATSYVPKYGDEGDDDLPGMGPTGRQIYAAPNTAMIVVEVYYRYEPIFPIVRPETFGIMGYRDMSAIATMVVRDDRDLSQIYNVEAVSRSTCI